MTRFSQVIASVTAVPVLLAATGCHRTPSPAAEPAPRALRADTASAPLASLQRDTTASIRAALARANAAATGADTIVVTPDSLTVHVGEVAVLGGLKIEARTAAGAVVPQFAPFLEVDDPAIAALGPAGLVGRRPGRTRLMIRALSLDTGTPTGRRVATVSVTVIP